VVPGLGLPNSQVPQSGHVQRRLGRPPAVTPPGTERAGLPARLKPASETTAPIEKALLVIRWQSVQWQA